MKTKLSTIAAVALIAVSTAAHAKGAGHAYGRGHTPAGMHALHYGGSFHMVHGSHAGYRHSHTIHIRLPGGKSLTL